MKITLKAPISMGERGEPVAELNLKPTGRTLRGLKIETSASGGITYEPHALAVVGLRMAGHVAAAEAMVDRMESLEDVNEVAQAVLSFLAPSPKAGNAPSP